MVPAPSSRLGHSCSRHLSRSQAEIPLIPAVQISRASSLDRIIEERGKPRMIVSDNGSEFTSNAILQWTDRTKVDWHYIAP